MCNLSHISTPVVKKSFPFRSEMLLHSVKESTLSFSKAVIECNVEYNISSQSHENVT